MGRSGLQYVQSIWKGGIPLEGANMAQNLWCRGTLPETNIFAPKKSTGRWISFWGPAYFQGLFLFVLGGVVYRKFEAIATSSGGNLVL